MDNIDSNEEKINFLLALEDIIEEYFIRGDTIHYPPEILFSVEDLENGWFKIFKNICVNKEGLLILKKLFNYVRTSDNS